MTNTTSGARVSMSLTQGGDQGDLEISWSVFSIAIACMTSSQLLYPHYPSVQRGTEIMISTP